MRMIPAAILSLPLLLQACASTGSGSSGAAGTPAASGATASAPGRTVWICPISGQEVVGAGHVGYYGIYEVHFASRADAEQFASLPKEKRAALAAQQVLAQKKITNTTCPLTGNTLNAAAAPVVWEGVVIGFYSVADANQFKSLPPARQQKVIQAWKQGPGAAPVSG